MAELDVLSLRFREGGKHPLDSVLGPLERRVLDVLWAAPAPLRVREIHARLKDDSAQTSIAVMLDRLHDKGLVKRVAATGRGGTHYTYSPVASREETERKIVGRVVDRLIKTFGPSAVSYFDERFKKKR
ncbi:hypothetical protein AUJ14_02040 [Candidatus Micrarchaeota archaeon CG1_02_55_22]|nr:MAG: hypothetical protein AUJ14_02040 [Candidatus Micrarchaeota archaeon CG1_02_55_22]